MPAAPPTSGDPPVPARRPRVLLSARAPRATTNPYLVQLAQALEPHAEVVHFTWARALAGRYDLLHWHWPEVALRRSGALARAAARTRFAALLVRVALRRTPVVATLHNPEPHERPGGAAERALLAAARRQTTWWVALNGRDAGPRTTLAPLGDQRPWYEPHLVPAGEDAATLARPVPGRLLFCGLVRPYKGVPELLGAFAALDDPAASLHVVGACPDPALARTVTALAAGDPRVVLRLGHAEDAALVAAVLAAQVVVLPHRRMHNSSAALTALSLGRPVLVPRTPVTDDLAAEVGERWVLRHDGPLAPGDLAAALAATADLLDAAPPGRGPRVPAPDAPDVPDLSARSWEVVGRAHAAAYAAALSARPRRAAHHEGRRPETPGRG